MTQSQRGHAGMAFAALLVIVLTAANWYLRPERGAFWLIGVGSLGAFWLVIDQVARRRRSATAPELALLWWSGIIAGLMVAGALALKLASTLGWAGEGLRERAFGLVMGAFLMVMGNAVPKIVGPLTADHCPASHSQALQRFTGWAFVLAGIGYCAAWLVLPVDTAQVISTATCAAAVVLVIGRVGWAMSRPRKSA